MTVAKNDEEGRRRTVCGPKGLTALFRPVVAAGDFSVESSDLADT